ncbi:ankyrin repeat domain-containing protein [Alcanivorax sp. S6407]|uniref:ankyrin repeat domain-containing protein n=1 Tax=Alcanivorax sp. S6407 TaxID=2926424 RepID=UPI001FF60701|nr:ankyrin repeat domain-containing protein [Alcanivorax sp. S6407]MCK0154297.1 ankyrin repeat domain-containing protein [Alcanivorax sp. S6407]
MTTQYHRLRPLMLAGTLALALGSTGCSNMKAVSAASQGDLATLQQLHNEGKNIHGKDLKMTTALYRAVEGDQTNIVTFLLDNGADINASNGFSKRTALMTAVETENAAMLTLLLERGADVNLADRKDNTPLTLAVDAGNGELAALLLNKGADPDHAGESTLTPLITSLNSDNLALATLLLDAGANPDLVVDESGVAPIHVAFNKQNQAMMELLLDHGADLERTFAGSTVLMNAVTQGNTSLADELLKRGANPSTTTNIGTPALFYALKLNQRALAARLLDAGADADATQHMHSSKTLLEWAVSESNRDAVMLLLEQGATVTDSALHSAITSSQVDTALVAALLASGIAPDGALEFPNVAAAAKANNLDVLNLLLAAGASPSPLATAQFDPALMYPAESGNVAMLDALLAAGADPNQYSANGFAIIYQAAYKNQPEIIKRLAAAGADLNSRSGKGGFTSLMTAADNGQKDAILALIGAQAEINATTSDGYSALYYAAGSNHPDVVTMLMAAGANPELGAGRYQWTPVHKAAQEGNYEVLENLLKYGANANARDTDGDTPMDLAMRKGYEKTPQVLGSYGGRINNYTAPKQSSGDTFGKVFATAAIAGLASSADIPSYATADIMSATVKDIWVENGQGNNLAQMQQQYARGNFEIRDPLVKEVFSASIEAEKETARLKQQLAREQAQQRKLQQEQRRQLEAQQKAANEEQRRRQQELVRQQQAMAAQQARQQQLREQQQAERARLQAARASQAAAPVQVAYRNEPAAAASAPRREPSARQASIQRGNMQASDKLNCPSCKGTLKQRNVTIGECTLASITVAYDVGAFFGEPIVRGDYKWQAANGTPEDCLDSSFAIWLKIQNGGAHGYVKVDPVVPKAGQESYSGTAGSPNWNEFICGFSGKQKTQCFEEDDAKTLLKKGSITSFTYSVQ